MSDKRDLTADVIKICAVITAMPRWVGALLAAEGFAVPADWLWWWLPVSAIFSAGMAITEGLAFAYVFNAWRTQKDKSADKLLWLAIISGGVFVMVLSPFTAAQVRTVTLAGMLSQDWALWVWSVAVAASTIVIVASVGYAQKQRGPMPEKREHKPEPKPEAQPQPKAEAKPEKKPLTLPEFVEIVAQNQAGEFGITEVQQWTGAGRTTGYKLLSQGEQQGHIEQVSRGQYVYRNGVGK